MDIQVFISKVAELFDETDISQITPKTKFHDLDEWSSIIGLQLILMIDEEFGKTIDGNDIRGAVTISDLYEIISKK